MTFDEYQQEALRTASHLPPREMQAMAAVGVCGEAGELADVLKKHLWHSHALDKEKVLKEAGDCAWYLAVLCAACDIRLSDVIEGNVRKLRARYPDGFDPERSKNRPPEESGLSPSESPGTNNAR